MDGAHEESTLLDYWAVVVRRRWAVYISVVSVVLIALLASFTMTPLYKSTVTLQIERKNPRILTFRDLSQMDYSWAAYSDFYETQYKIIASQPVSRSAAQRLGLADHPSFENRPDRPGLLSRLLALTSRQRDDANAVDPLEAAAALVRAGLDVSPVRNSHLVKISWISDDADLAARVANGVADAYIQVNMESQFSTSGQAEEFLINQIGAVKRELAEIEGRLQSYGESKRIVSIDDSSNITLKALQNISERRTEAQTALAAAAAAHRAARDAAPDALPEVMNSALIRQLRGDHATLEAELSEKAERFGPNWPGMQNLRSKLTQSEARLESEIGRIATQVRASAEAAYLRALQEVDNLDRLLTQHESAAQHLKRDAVEFATLQSEVEKKRETLNALITRQNEMALSTRLKDLEATSGNIRIIERASVAAAPFRPNIRLNLAMGLVLGTLLGVGLALLLEHLDNSIGSAEHLQRLVALPVLAVIPRHGPGSSRLARVRRRPQPAAREGLDKVAHRDVRAAVSEAYRDLRTSILLSNPGAPPRKIVVTSALPEEGKTATAINLSIVLAQLGARVLLVDTDLRRPRLHRALGVSNRSGMSHYLSGLEEDPRQLAQPSGIDNLDLLPSGPIPPNPSELLNSSTFIKLPAHFLDDGYDHVVFDSPPVLSVSDPVIIASSMDTCVLVVRAGRTPRQSVRVAVERLLQAGDVSFGTVLNDVDVDAQGRYAYRYDPYKRPDDGVDDDDAPASIAGGGAGA